MNESRLVDEERVEIAHMHLEVFQMLYEEHENAEWGKMIFFDGQYKGFRAALNILGLLPENESTPEAPTPGVKGE